MIDRRGARRSLPVAGGGLGLAGIAVYLLLQVLGGGGSGAVFDVPGAFDEGLRAPGQDGAAPIPPEEDPERDLRDFSAYVFTDAQAKWQATIEKQGDRYKRAKLVLYRQGVSTGCGSASSAVGPFYCPADQRVYIDLSFYSDMREQLRAEGDFAWAYVIAHEVGHHVQRVTGTSDEVRRLQRDDSGRANELSVRLELQADCYAGVWASTTFAEGALEEGDLEEAFGAAEAVGDDRLQGRRGGSIDPDSFTHGTSEQRRRWFHAGYDGGRPDACDTFSPDDV